MSNHELLKTLSGFGDVIGKKDEIKFVKLTSTERAAKRVEEAAKKAKKAEEAAKEEDGEEGGEPSAAQ